jgi:hypothetical protein
MAKIRRSIVIVIEDFIQGLGLKDLERPAFELLNCGAGQSGADGIRQSAEASGEQGSARG